MRIFQSSSKTQAPGIKAAVFCLECFRTTSQGPPPWKEPRGVLQPDALEEVPENSAVSLSQHLQTSITCLRFPRASAGILSVDQRLKVHACGFMCSRNTNLAWFKRRPNHNSCAALLSSPILPHSTYPPSLLLVASSSRLRRQRMLDGWLFCQTWPPLHSDSFWDSHVKRYVFTPWTTYILEVFVSKCVFV